MKESESSQEFYECDFCGEMFKKAEECFKHEEKHYVEHNKILELYKNGEWSWFIFRYKNFYKQFIFSKFIRYVREIDCFRLKLFNYNSDKAYCYPDIEIIDILSPMEMYKKYKELVKPAMKHFYIPQKTVDEIDRTYHLHVTTEISYRICSSPKDELARKALSLEEPFYLDPIIKNVYKCGFISTYDKLCKYGKL